MKASIVELRYHMNDVLKALDRNEEVEILYRGKTKGYIIPAHKMKQIDVRNHPYFGSSKQKTSVKRIMQKLRRNRYADL